MKISFLLAFILLVIGSLLLLGVLVDGALPNIMSQMKEQITVMESKCLITMKGLNCPTTSSRRNLMDDHLPIIAGVGYSREDHTIRPQILQSPSSVPTSGEESVVKTMKSAQEYFSMLFPRDGQTVFNGLYSHGSAATDLIFSRFFEGNLFIADIQKQYFTHTVSLSTIQVTDEFQMIIDLLPYEMDTDLYMQVITSFGDSIATNIVYGGVIDLTTSVKSCYNDPSMLSYLDLELQLSIDDQTDTSSLPNGYIRYHKVAQLDIVGGNPQISSKRERVSTFASNPVPVKFETIPIWRAFPDGPKQANMKIIYNNYIQSKADQVNQMINDLNAKMAADASKLQPVTVFKQDRKDSIIENFGSRTSIANGNSVEIDAFVRMVFQVNFPYDDPTFIIGLRPKIYKNLDGSFYFNFLRGDCDQYNWDVCKWTSYVLETFGGVSLKSRTGKDECIQLAFGQSVQTRYTTSYLYVCTGCTPYISQDGKSLSCGCPYIE
ncbi:predicted protein [Naegleria gruberi]|uniref:Predicted protein n=1 Tax=Naegleria gruberi TaxID=5762 RepID=D2VVF0_NAEGR|nr:uncharacterized protein NAEGRDRAFT_72994 [Naegleria gruberi]EFC39298.1 predicted protein [Naegleria gruberi]|eukprot:XP_002672042.1 predicted protein [Naegleria gruberi strain NEG-M]